MKQYFPLSLAGFVVVVGCGGSNVSANSYPNSSTGVAARAAEPRQNDPTAASPPPMPVSSGLSATLTGVPPTPPPASSWKKKTDLADGGSPDPSADEAAPPSQDQTTPKKIGARHVLIQWMGSERAPTSVVRSRDQALAIAQEVLKKAKAGQDFARLAVDYSDEPGAAARGGSLGRFGRGQMVGAFEAAAFKLSVGQISDIVESPFGYHIIQRTE